MFYRRTGYALVAIAEGIRRKDVSGSVFHWEVVQLAERSALDREVAGSKPAFPANPTEKGKRWSSWAQPQRTRSRE